MNFSRLAISSDFVDNAKNIISKVKVKKEGDNCRKCNIPVIKKSPKRKNPKSDMISKPNSLINLLKLKIITPKAHYC